MGVYYSDTSMKGHGSIRSLELLKTSFGPYLCFTVPTDYSGTLLSHTRPVTSHNQVFGRASSERSDRRDSDQIENEVAIAGETSRRKWDAGGVRRKTLFTTACTPRRWVHWSLRHMHNGAPAASRNHLSSSIGASMCVVETGV